MNNDYDNVLKSLEDAQVALDSGLYDAAANYIRQIAEVLSDFYVKKYELIRNNKGESGPDFTFNKAINAIWNSKHPVLNKIRKPLVNFLCLAQQIGNKGSHPGESVEKLEAEHLIFYFEHYIKTQFMFDCGAWSPDPDGYIDVTAQFGGKRITIYSMKAGHYASTREDFDNSPICCDIDEPKKWEIYLVQVDQEGWASFLSHTGKYVSVDMDARGEIDCPPIRAIGPASSAWEKFKIYGVDGYYAFKARINNKWVMCQADWEENPLFAVSDHIDWWEEFDIKVL